MLITFKILLFLLFLTIYWFVKISPALPEKSKPENQNYDMELEE